MGGDDPFPVSGPRQTGLLAVCALLVLASATATVYFCESMTGGMPMPGRWTMSMAWMAMPGQSLAASYLSFTLMWLVMMVAMMLPAVARNLSKYRLRVAYFGGGRAASLTAVVAFGYFTVWAFIGGAVYPLGFAAAVQAMQSAAVARMEPSVAATALMFAGCFQWSAHKARLLERCRGGAACCSKLPRSMADAWRQGLRLGSDCGLCCCGLMIALLALASLGLFQALGNA